MSHELTDGAVPDAGPLPDLGMNTCVVGTTEPVPCGHCGQALRTCVSDGRWSAPGACTGETAMCGLDVMLLADVTGSHTGVFRAAADSLANYLVLPLEGDADVRVGVSAFADYPVGGYGTVPPEADVPFIGVLEPTHDVGSVDSAIRGIMFYGGVDAPESEIEGLNDLSGGMPSPYAVPFVCHSGGVGGGCWRGGAAWRVIVVMTDTASHSLPGPSGALVQPYGSDLVPPAPRWDDVRRQIASSGTYVYWIVPNTTGDASTDNVSASAQAGELARQLGEDPSDAVSIYDGSLSDTQTAIRAVRERLVAHFGIHGAAR